MSDVKRYRVLATPAREVDEDGNVCAWYTEEIEDCDGEYVLFTDHERALAEARAKTWEEAARLAKRTMSMLPKPLPQLFSDRAAAERAKVTQQDTAKNAQEAPGSTNGGESMANHFRDYLEEWISSHPSDAKPAIMVGKLAYREFWEEFRGVMISAHFHTGVSADSEFLHWCGVPVILDTALDENAACIMELAYVKANSPHLFSETNR